MADIGDNNLLLEQQRVLQRYSNLELHRRDGISRWRNRQQDEAGKDIYKTAAQYRERSDQMQDDHRKGRIKEHTVKGKVQTSYDTDDLMRTNYAGQYEQ